MWNWTAASTVFPTSGSTTWNGKSFCNLAASRHCDSGIRISAATRKVSVITIFNELQARVPHPLPDYTKADESCGETLD